MTCQHAGCAAEATTIIADGTQLCLTHVAVLRALHQRKQEVLDPGLDGDADVDLKLVDAALSEFAAALKKVKVK